MHDDVRVASDGRREVRVERHVERVVTEHLLIVDAARAEVTRVLRYDQPRNF